MLKYLCRGIEEVIDIKFEAAKDRLATKSDLTRAKVELRKGWKPVWNQDLKSN